MSRGRTVRTPNARAKFLSALGDTGNITLAAGLSGLERSTLYDWRAEDAEFAAAWNEALEIATDALEAEARRRAMQGVAEPLVSQGRIIKDDEGKPMFVQRYSDSLMQLLLRAHRPEKFRERTETKHVGPDGGAVQIEAVRERIVGRVLRLAKPGGSGSGTG